jgi:HK97 family phage portal protein
MWLLDSLFGTEKRSLVDAIDGFLRGDDFAGPISTQSGAYVNEESALKVTTVYSAIKLIAWTIASLPIITYRRLDRGKSRASEQSIYGILHDCPNPEQTPFEFKSLLSVHQNLWGAGVAEIEFDRSGNPVALWPLPPWRVTPRRTQGGTLFYELRDSEGTTRNIPAENTICFPALSTNRGVWKSPIAIHRETIGLAMATKDFGAKVFGQGTNPAGFISHPGTLSEKSEKRLRNELVNYQGLGNSHRLMLLEDGMKFERIGLPPQDAQYLESQKFSVSDIARIYNVPLYLLQDHEKSTSWGSGIEEMNLGFISYTLRPYLVQWEQELNRRLIHDPTFFAEFLIDALLRGKLSERYNAYTLSRNGGWMSVNDIREIENMNPIGEEGDIYLSPLNYQSAKFANEKAEPVKPVSDNKKEVNT